MARRSSFRSIALLFLVPLAAFALFFAVRFVREQLFRPPAEVVPVRRPKPPAPKKEAAPVPSRSAASPDARTAPAPPARGPASIALILDDVGFDHQPLESAMRIDRNVSFSILPNARNASECAEILHASGYEVMCHLPMEPVDFPRHSPGEHAVMTTMSDEEIAQTTRDDIAAVPWAVGVNNHMGSAATADPRVMRSVLTALPQGMFFIDSMTTRNSIAGRLARELNVPTADRRVFLDDVQTEGAVRRQLAELTAAAEQHGIAVGIGHMYPVTVKVLTEQAPELRARGFRFIRASEAVGR